MHIYSLFIFGCILSFQAIAENSTTTIAFGSCLKQSKPQPVWDALVKLKPDVFLFIGDNVYADTNDVKKMKSVYAQLANQPGFQKLKKISPIHATWDDHDYGENDAGADYEMREQSEQVFLEFFGFPQDSTVRNRPGIYHSQHYELSKGTLQLILLDTRYFRSALVRAETTDECPRVNHALNTDPEATILGEEQWKWLHQQLQTPADVRIIVSSIQVIPTEHCFEKWANFPLEREKLLQIIQDTQASGVILISGDRHMAELSRLDDKSIGYPIYELTSSGMNSTSVRAGKGEKNRYRVTVDNFRVDNFGVIQIDWGKKPVTLNLQIRNAQGGIELEKKIPLNNLS